MEAHRSRHTQASHSTGPRGLSTGKGGLRASGRAAGGCSSPASASGLLQLVKFALWLAGSVYRLPLWRWILRVLGSPWIGLLHPELPVPNLAPASSSC